MRGRLTGPATGFVPPAVGLALGLAVVSTSSSLGTAPWLLWAPLAVGLTTAAGALFVYGFHRWADLVAMHPVRVRDVAIPTATVAIVAVLGINVTWLLPGAARTNWRNSVLLTVSLLAAIPASGAMYGVRLIASKSHLIPTAGGQLELLLGLRRLLQRLLAAVGSLVALITLQGGALLALERSMHTAFGARPPQYVLVFGATGSLLVALVYVPGWTALQRHGQRLCDELFPMRSLGEASAILSTAEDRQKLEMVLGVDRSVIADMQTGLIIFAPLVASAASVLLPH